MDDSSISKTLDQLRKEILTVKTIRNLMEVMMYDWMMMLQDSQTGDCKFSSADVDQITKPALEAYNK